MNKSKLLLLSSVAVVVVAGVVGWMVTRHGSDAYLRALPTDATALARLDVMEIVDEADLSKQEQLQLLRRLTDSDGKIGFDLSRPLYGFVAPDGNFGCVASVGDKGDLNAFCENLHRQGKASEVTHQRGYAWTTVQQQWLLAYDAHTALFMGPAVGAAQDPLRNEMYRLLEQGKTTDGQTRRLMERLDMNDEPFMAVLTPEVMPQTVRRYLWKMHVSSAEDALLEVMLDADDNELVLENKLIPLNQTVKDELARLQALMRPVKADLIDHAHADHVAWLTVNVKGQTLLEALRTVKTIRTALVALNLTFDADRILQAVDGDVAIELPRLSDILNPGSTALQNVSLTAKVANTNFLQGATSWGNNVMGVRALSPTDFALDFGLSPMYFGVKGNTFYLAPHQGPSTEGNPYLHHQRDDIRGERLYATVALSSLRGMMDMTGGAGTLLDAFERLDVEMEDVGDFDVKFIAPEGTNIAKKLLLNE